MTGKNKTAAKLSPKLRMGFLVSTAFATVLMAGQAARAACNPAAANNVTATCTGITINQGTGAPGTSLEVIGYGNSFLDNLNVTIVPGATVTGSVAGISANTATVANSGTVTGVSTAIYGANTATLTVINSGTIAASSFGILVGTVNVTNSGAITGGDTGIYAEIANVTNSGAIKGTGNSGIWATTATVLNSGSISGRDYGIQANTATVTNSGSISGDSGIWAITANVTNSGTIIGDYGIRVDTTANVTNSGSILGLTNGITATTATVTNSGSISGSDVGIYGATSNVTNSGTITGTGIGGIYATTKATVINAGTITGVQGIYAATGDVTNSGTIIGTGGTAIFFAGGGGSSLTVLPGARFGGAVNFGGGADKVTFGAGNWVLNTASFDAALSTVTTPDNPYAVTPNQIIVADLSGFGAMNRAVMDITGWIASVLPDTPVFEPASGGAANAFAAIEAAAPRFDHAFGTVSEAMVIGAMAFAPTTPVFKGGAVTDRDGNSVWAKGFGGRREQTTDGSFIGGVTVGYGGAIGYDRQITPDTKLGGFIGGSTNETTLDLNAGRFDTDTLFGGLYARSFFGATFLDLALIGGKLNNESKRNIGGGLALETASASYDGWFVNPAMTLGHRFAFDHGVTVTPALKVRYVAAQFGGYTETGSSANLTVGDRNMQAVEERAEVTLANTHTFGNGSRLGVRVTGGVLAQQRTGDATVNIALVGQNFIAATPDKQNVYGVYGGAGLDWQLGRMALFAAGEVTGMNDNVTSFTGKGGVRVVW